MLCYITSYVIQLMLYDICYVYNMCYLCYITYVMCYITYVGYI